MKAIRVHQFGDPEVLSFEDTDVPEVGAGSILVKVFAIGINPVETYIRSGIYGERDFPFIPGTDAAGMVEKVGDGVEKFKPGDRVYVAGTQTGTYAEFTLCQQHHVHELPENVTFRQGASIGIPYATAYRALMFRGGARPGDRVLIHGASGGVGTAAVQIAAAYGMKLAGTAGTEKGRQLVTDQGAHFVYDHTQDGYLEKAVEECTDGEGFDVIVEMLANVNLDRDLDALARHGRVVVVGNRGRIEIDPRKTMAKDTSIHGMALFNAPEDEIVSIHAGIIAGLRNGTFSPVVDRAFPLNNAAGAHEEVMESGSYGNIVLIPDWG